MVFNRKEYKKEWNKNNPDKFKIGQWKFRGLISNDYESIYNRWLNSKNCEECGHDYSYYKKCMDHCHDSHKFRAILCDCCNKNKKMNNTSGYPNISYIKNIKRWQYTKSYKKVFHTKHFKTKNQAIIYKWFYELGYKIQI